MYTRESDLVRDFAALLRGQAAPWPDMGIAFEFNYHSGRVDIVGATTTKELFSFEAKLTRWREALYQAYRSTSFSHHAYVVLPESTAQKAAMWEGEFEIRGVGLCSVSNRGIEIIIPASQQHPLLPWLTGDALEYITRVKFAELAGDHHATASTYPAGDCQGVQQATRSPRCRVCRNGSL